MHLAGFKNEMYESERKKLDDAIVENLAIKIVATDISEDAINISKINAGIAGVEKMISFAQCDFEKTIIPQNENGVIYFNPEYGDRLGEETALQATYKRMGDFMKQHCKGYTGYIFTGNLELAKKIGLKPSRRIEFYTSKIDCRLFEYELYAGTRRKEDDQVV
jgi:putative N6-adenine-specific DNA methylase